MGQILLNAGGLFLIILLGFFIKRIGLLSKADGSTLSVIVLNLTLPATIIINLAKLGLRADLFLMIIIAIGVSVLQIFLGWLTSRKQAVLEQEFTMYMASGFNIGNFTMPFVQSFLPVGIPLISMFDLGNSIMLAGGTSILTERLIGRVKDFDLKAISLRLLKSVPFTCYVLMLVLRLFSVDLPGGFLTVLQPIANANTFLSMFMIGLFLELRLPGHALNSVFKALAVRYGFGLLMVLFFYLLPIPHLFKLVLCLLSVTPVPVYGVINAILAGMAEETVGFCSSVSFLISLPLMTGILLVLGLG